MKQWFVIFANGYRLGRCFCAFADLEKLAAKEGRRIARLANDAVAFH